MLKAFSHLKIGKNNIISPKAIIHDNVIIGDNNNIHDDVIIYPNTKIGNNNNIFPRNIIGEFPISSNDKYIKQMTEYNKKRELKKIILGFDKPFPPQIPPI